MFVDKSNTKKLKSFRSKMSRLFRIKRYKDAEGKLTNCESFRGNKIILSLLKKSTGEKVYVDPGCGFTYLCQECGIDYSREKAGRILALFGAIKRRFPKTYIGMLEITLPRDHKIFLNDDLESYRELFKIGKNVVERFFPELPSIAVLHNWSSDNPNEKNPHLHIFVIGLRKDGSYYQNVFNDSKTSMWQSPEDLNYLHSIVKDELKVSQEFQIDLHWEYFRLDRKGIKKNDFISKVFYVFRSPITDFIDYCKFCGIDPVLSKEYLERMTKLIGLQRVRYTGWLSNSTKKQTLEKLNIFVKHWISDFEIIEILSVRYSYSKDGIEYYKLSSKESIPCEMVKNLRELTTTNF